MKLQVAPLLSRRQFLKRATAAAALPLIVPGSVLGLNGAVAPSNRIGFGAIGVGNRAMDTLPTFLSFPDIQYVAVSDFRADRLKTAKAKVDAKYGNEDCFSTKDFREVLARKDVDAVMISTPDHWHTLISLLAIRAGKDVQCEKPTLTIHEGQVLSQRVLAEGHTQELAEAGDDVVGEPLAVEHGEDAVLVRDEG